MTNIVNTYTMSHINHFLTEIGRVERRKFKEAIIAARVAQTDSKHYEQYLRQLAQADRVEAQRQAKAKGQHFMTYEEQMKLESQKHVRFNQMSAEQQEKLTAERESLWSQIPAHIQAKSRKLAGR